MSKLKKIINVVHRERIDKYISSNSNFSRNDIKKLIKNHCVFVDGILVRKPNFIVNKDNKILITDIIEKTINAKPESIKIDVLYEDKDIIIVNKKSGMVVHPSPGHSSKTLVNALLFRFKNLSNVNGKIRPGIVHRIDKDTSGLLIVAKNNDSHNFLVNQIKEHKIQRIYLAWVKGKIKNKIIHVKLPIGRDLKNRQKMSIQKINSKDAITHIYVQKILEDKTLIKCELETGRTHQIRVHLSHIGHPIIGDPIYGQKIDEFGQRLHAYKLILIHPVTRKKMEFISKPPLEFDS